MGLSRHHHDGRGHTHGLDLFEQGNSIFTRHHDVGEDQIETLILYQLQSAPWLIANCGFMSSETKGTRERGQSVGFVVDDEQVGFFHAAVERPLLRTVLTHACDYCRITEKREAGLVGSIRRLEDFKPSYSHRTPGWGRRAAR